MEFTIVIYAQIRYKDSANWANKVKNIFKFSIFVE